MSESAPESISEPTSEPKPTWAPTIPSALVASLLGCVVGLGLALAIDPVFPYPDLPPVPMEPGTKHLPLIEKHQVARGEYFSRNYAVSFAIIGACMGAAMGLVTTRNRRLASMIAGAVPAAAGGGVAALFVGKAIGVAVEQNQGFTLVEAGKVHLLVWLAISVGLALGVGWVQGGLRLALNSVLVALVATVIAVTVYLTCASVLFLADNMAYLIPLSTLHRAVWLTACSALIGILLAYGLRPPKPKIS